MELIKIMKEFGLSEKETELYLKLLELGSTTSGILRSELGFYSKTIYELLNKLIGKGLVSFVIKSNTKYFEADNLEKFLDIIEEEKENLDLREKNFRKILPELNERKLLKNELQEATIYKEKNGMKTIFEDQLKQKEEILVFGGGGNFKESLMFYSELWHKKRVKLKIRVRLLLSEKFRGNKDLKNYKLIKIKFLPEEFDNPAPAVVYGNKVAITIWGKVPLAILIKGSEVSRSYKSYFNLLWKIAKN